MKTIEAYRMAVQSALKDTYRICQPTNLYAPITYLLDSQGKQIRPCFTLIAYHLFKEDYTPAIPTALAIELFHNFTLMHDDIMDKASLRRGQSTVHSKWNVNTAILSGDLMMIKAYEYLSEAIRVNAQIFSEFNKVATWVCEGQQLDMDFEKSEGVTVEAYIDMITKKTAVLLGVALKIGGMQAGASKEDVEALYQFGKHIGIAFQLMDDYLDLFAPDGQFGKQVGGDVLANKKTFLSIKALEKGKGDSLKILEDLQAMTQLEPERKINLVKTVYKDIGIDKLTLEEIAFYYNASLGFLDHVDVDISRKRILEQFAKQIKERIF